VSGGPARGDFSTRLGRRLTGASHIAIVGIGDELSAFDRLGMLAAEAIERQGIPGIMVLYAGTVPESVTGPLRKIRPGHVILLDAADMDEPPGTLDIIDPGTIRAELFSTHALPLSAVMEFIRQDVGTEVTLLGIQPDTARPDTGLDAEGEGYLNENIAALGSLLKDWSRAIIH
jgi:hydrogenase 3 maturation protease